MKKLIVAFVAMATAVVANAAAMNWGADYTYSMNGVAGEDRGTTDAFIAYVFDASAYAYTDAQAAFAASDVATLIGNSLGSAPVAADDLGGFQAQNQFAGAAGSSISAYLVIFDAATADTASNMYLSEVQTAVAPSSGVAGQLTFGDAGDMVGMASSSSWMSTSAVPEPTSGLLLLLGMAGLALKRKNA